jgi:hypothetical protein
VSCSSDIGASVVVGASEATTSLDDDVSCPSDGISAVFLDASEEITSASSIDDDVSFPSDIGGSAVFLDASEAPNPAGLAVGSVGVRSEDVAPVCGLCTVSSENSDPTSSASHRYKHIAKMNIDNNNNNNLDRDEES